MIGAIDLDSIHWNNGSAWLGIAIGDPVNRGLGYGSEAMHMVLRFAFDELNLHRVQLTVFAYNLHAIRLYERLGFVQEGVWREALHRDGQRWDVLHYALLRHEWRGSRG
jgi:RimJ/RimL family protein N-acetyltransferase